MARSGFNWSAGTGQVIAGQLTRDYRGRFAGADRVPDKKYSTQVTRQMQERSSSSGSAAAIRSTVAGITLRRRSGNGPDPVLTAPIADENRANAIRRLINSGDLTSAQAKILVRFARGSQFVEETSDFEAGTPAGFDLIVNTAEGEVRLSSAASAALKAMNFGQPRLAARLMKLARFRAKLVQQRLGTGRSLGDFPVEMPEPDMMGEKAMSQEDAFEQALRRATYGLWSGRADWFEFVEIFTAAISKYYTFAWHEGAKKCGILPNELSDAEKDKLAEEIDGQTEFIERFADHIQAHDKEHKHKLAPLYERLSLWVNRRKGIIALAQTMACADRKLVWVLGATEEHCSTCAKLAGKVKRASQWAERNLVPQNAPNDQLECGGWKCDCSLEITDKPLSKGPLPRTP